MLVCIAPDELYINSIRGLFRHIIVWNHHTRRKSIYKLLELYKYSSFPPKTICLTDQKGHCERRNIPNRDQQNLNESNTKGHLPSSHPSLVDYRRNEEKRIRNPNRMLTDSLEAGLGYMPSCSFDSSASDPYTYANNREAISDDTILTVDGKVFRKLIKRYCKFPAYFRPVVYDWLKTYKKIYNALDKEDLLSMGSIHKVSRSSTDPKLVDEMAPFDCADVRLRDFLRFWRPEVRNSSRDIQFLMTLIQPTRQLVLALEQGCYGFSDYLDYIEEGTLYDKTIHQGDLRPYVESLVNSHPDLRSIRKDKAGVRCQRYMQRLHTASSTGFGFLTWTMMGT